MIAKRVYKFGFLSRRRRRTNSAYRVCRRLRRAVKIPTARTVGWATGIKSFEKSLKEGYFLTSFDVFEGQKTARHSARVARSVKTDYVEFLAGNYQSFLAQSRDNLLVVAFNHICDTVYYDTAIKVNRHWFLRFCRDGRGYLAHFPPFKIVLLVYYICLSDEYAKNPSNYCNYYIFYSLFTWVVCINSAPICWLKCHSLII